MNFRSSSPVFVGRFAQLNLLDQLWASSRAELLILSGRRRVGKTRLLIHWAAGSGANALYWVAEPTSAFDQLRSFSQALYNFENPSDPAPQDFSYANWRQAFGQAARLTETRRLALAIDEFTYLLATEPGIAGILQNLWDQRLCQADLFLTISGSHIGMMERQVISYQAPLYGRASALLRLNPLPFSATRQFFPRYRPDERVAIYAMLGGIPAYWEQFDQAFSLDKNIRRQFLTPTRLLQDEPLLLLQDFLTDPHNYLAILRAIAHGARTPKEMAGFTGLDAHHIPAYVSKLVDTGFVERKMPVTAPDSLRLGRHHITDPFLRFYFRFLAQRQAQLAQGIQDQALAEIKKHLIDFIGTYTWEELCREWILQAGVRGQLPFLPDQVGSTWTRTAQVDVVGVNFMEKTLILGECQWSAAAVERPVLSGLVEKAAQVVPAQGNWRVYFLGFARCGWNSAARDYSAEIERSPLQGGNWRSVGMRLLDLQQVDDDLSAWG